MKGFLVATGILIVMVLFLIGMHCFSQREFQSLKEHLRRADLSIEYFSSSENLCLLRECEKKWNRLESVLGYFISDEILNSVQVSLDCLIHAAEIGAYEEYYFFFYQSEHSLSDLEIVATLSREGVF